MNVEHIEMSKKVEGEKWNSLGVKESIGKKEDKIKD